MTEYRINLAKSLTSTPEGRKRFYYGMLIYQALCAGLMVNVIYLSSFSIIDGLRASRNKRNLVKSVTSVSEFSKSFYKNPEQAYAELALYSEDLTTLRSALAGRSYFQPVISQLFAEFPEGVALESVTASVASKKVSFGLVVPLSDEEGGDAVRKLQAAWTANEELMKRITNIRPTTGERRVVAGKPVFFVEFECLFK
jgi:hypothetical protein